MDAIRHMRTGPTRSEPLHAERHQPYGTSRTRRVGHVNAEAGPSTLVPPHVPYVGLPITQSTEGISERTANATNNKSAKEKKEAPVSNFYRSHFPRVTEWLFGVRSPNGQESFVVKGSHVVTGSSWYPLRAGWSPGRRRRRRAPRRP